LVRKGIGNKIYRLMKTLEYIERVCQIWDGTDAHASICLRYIELSINKTELTEIDDKDLMNFIANENTET